MRIELITPHTHAGRKYPAGATLEMPAHKAEWLIGIGTAKAAEPAPPIAPTPKAARPAPIKE
jgi:hypothetical protein